MKNLNIVRLLLGGLASAAVIYLAEYIVNGVILAHGWMLWGAVVNRSFVTPPEGVSMALWAAQALIAGIAGTFVYAAILDWVGIRMRAAYISALVVWSVGWLGMSLDKLALGVEPAKMIHYNMLAALLACLVGQYLASLIYRDKDMPQDDA